MHKTLLTTCQLNPRIGRKDPWSSMMWAGRTSGIMERACRINSLHWFPGTTSSVILCLLSSPVCLVWQTFILDALHDRGTAFPPFFSGWRGFLTPLELEIRFGDKILGLSRGRGFGALIGVNPKSFGTWLLFCDMICFLFCVWIGLNFDFFSKSVFGWSVQYIPWCQEPWKHKDNDTSLP